MGVEPMKEYGITIYHMLTLVYKLFFSSLKRNIYIPKVTELIV